MPLCGKFSTDRRWGWVFQSSIIRLLKKEKERSVSSHPWHCEPVVGSVEQEDGHLDFAEVVGWRVVLPVDLLVLPSPVIVLVEAVAVDPLREVEDVLRRSAGRRVTDNVRDQVLKRIIQFCCYFYCFLVFNLLVHSFIYWFLISFFRVLGSILFFKSKPDEGMIKSYSPTGQWNWKSFLVSCPLRAVLKHLESGGGTTGIEKKLKLIIFWVPNVILLDHFGNQNDSANHERREKIKVIFDFFSCIWPKMNLDRMLDHAKKHDFEK